MIPGSFCTATSTARPYVRTLCERLKIEWHLHRKFWEFGLVCETLETAGLLRPGARGLGFGVGLEPLVAWFASMGVEVVATDTQAGGWYQTSKDKLNSNRLCDKAEFTRLVSYRQLDMNWIPDDLTDFDFCWSCCSLDHLGSIRLGKRFVYLSLGTLKPGGIAVHTGEFGPALDWKSPDYQDTVVWTAWDIEEVSAWLSIRGHAAPVDLSPELTDQDVVTPGKYHIRKLVKGVESTSFGLVVTKGPRA